MSATLIAETITALPVEPLLEQLRVAGIRLPRPAEVRDYLTRYPDVVTVTRKACELTATEFSGKAELSLELYVDPEIDDQYLTLYVRRESYDASVWAAIERIQEGYAEAMTPATGWLLVMPDYRAAVHA